MNKPWFMYVVICSDNSLYCGIAIDPYKRVDEHNNSKKGAKYTRTRRPVKLVFQQTYPNRSEASKAEYQFKQLTREEKIKYISSCNGIDLEVK